MDRTDRIDRYHRQTLLTQIGEKGQQRLASSGVLLLGCGALGTVTAEQLARAGVGFIRICDRDIVELTNLQRQTLFEESDAAEGIPKAIAAVNRLRRINTTITIDPHVIDIHSGNVEQLIDRIDIILDGTDNAETRYLLNDAAVKHLIPWIYGACVGTTGRVMGIVPGRSPCLRCLFPDPAGPGELATCDTAGVLAPAANVVASLQVVEAMKILLGDPSAATEMITLDLWPLRMKSISTIDARQPDCPTCGQRDFSFLNKRPGVGAAVLCGRNTVQLTPPQNGTFQLEALKPRLESAGCVHATRYFLRCQIRQSNLTLTLFPDGRALVHGTADPAVARSIYARIVGC
jgi:molybdopterin-synthase adenylyltransferase